MRLGWIRDERGLDPRGLIYRKVCLWGDSFCSFQERIRQPAKGFHLVSGESVSHSVVSMLFDSMNCNPPGPSVHGVLQARILARVAIPFSRGSS